MALSASSTIMASKFETAIIVVTMTKDHPPTFKAYLLHPRRCDAGRPEDGGSKDCNNRSPAL